MQNKNSKRKYKETNNALLFFFPSNQKHSSKKNK